MTTLLHPSAAADEAAAALPPSAGHAHSEELGAADGGVCCFQLAAPPSDGSLRLMRAFMHQLSQRLELQAARLQAAAGAAAGAGPCSLRCGGACSDDECGASYGGGAKVLAAVSAPVAVAAQAPGASMPADCFWASV